jgi:hypothetical protein
MAWGAPTPKIAAAPKVAAATPATTDATLSMPTTPMMSVPMTGAAATAICTMRDSESCTRQSNGNQARESGKW